MKNKVSVIVPVYNVEQYLDRCIESLVNQTLKEIEIILVDDESPDNCPKMCDEYSKKYKNIKVIHKKNQGLGMARNSGLEIATGEYIAFIDSDDYIDLDFYEKTYNNAKLNNSDICFGEVKFMDRNLKNTISFLNPYTKKVFTGTEVNDYVLANLLHVKNEKDFKGFMGTGVWEAIYSKKIFDENNLIFCSERKFISEDYIFHLDYIPKCNTISFVEGTYYYHCENNDSLTSVFREDRFNKNKILYTEMFSKIKDIDFNIDVKGGIYSLFLSSVRHILLVAFLNRKTIGNKKFRAIFKEIVNDEMVKEALVNTKEYDVKVKIFNLTLKIKSFNLMYILEFLNNM